MNKKIAAVAALALAATLLASCGKSPEARKADAVRCDAYGQSMTQAAIVGGAAGQFVESLNHASAGHPSADGNKVAASIQLGEQLVSQMDAAKATAAATEGAKLWQEHLAGKDASSAVAFLDGCVTNYDRLLEDAG